MAVNRTYALRDKKSCLFLKKVLTPYDSSDINPSLTDRQSDVSNLKQDFYQMGKSYREGRSKGLSHYSQDGYGYDRNFQGKGFKVVSRQSNKQNKLADRERVYEERERPVDFR